MLSQLWTFKIGICSVCIDIQGGAPRECPPDVKVQINITSLEQIAIRGDKGGIFPCYHIVGQGDRITPIGVADDATIL